jgi:hypothetical protein
VADVVQMAEIIDREKLDKAELSDEFVARNGLVLKLKKVNRLVVVEAGRKIPMPVAPRFYNDEKGREEENPSHPDYIEAVREANYARGMMTIGVYITLGTEIKSLGEGMQRPEEKEWAETLAELGIDIPSASRPRYVAWLKYYALEDDELTELTNKSMRFSGITLESDVIEAKESFRG